MQQRNKTIDYLNSQDNPGEDLVHTIGNISIQSRGPNSEIFIRIKVKNRAILAHALIDTGNLSICCISDSFFKTLGLKVLPCDIHLSAPNRQKIDVIGFSQPFSIFLENIERSFLIQPIIISNLSVPLNISRAFLAENTCNISFSPNGTFLTCNAKSTRLHSLKRSLLAGSLDYRIRNCVASLKSQNKQEKTQNQAHVLSQLLQECSESNNTDERKSNDSFPQTGKKHNSRAEKNLRDCSDTIEQTFQRSVELGFRLCDGKESFSLSPSKATQNAKSQGEKFVHNDKDICIKSNEPRDQNLPENTIDSALIKPVKTTERPKGECELACSASRKFSDKSEGVARAVIMRAETNAFSPDFDHGEKVNNVCQNDIENTECRRPCLNSKTDKTEFLHQTTQIKKISLETERERGEVFSKNVSKNMTNTDFLCARLKPEPAVAANATTVEKTTERKAVSPKWHCLRLSELCYL